MRKIDKVQYNVMETLRNCKLEHTEVMNVMLSIAVSIASEIDPKEPLKLIEKNATQIKAWQVDQENNPQDYEDE